MNAFPNSSDITNGGIDRGFVDELRRRVESETPPAPSYDQFQARSRTLSVAPSRTGARNLLPRVGFVAAAVVVIVAAIGIGRYLIPSPIDPADQTAAVPRRVHTFDTATQAGTGPECWISFQNEALDGGCSEGFLQVVEYGDENGYVDGWNSFVSVVTVPDGWDIFTYHQMWDLGAAESTRRQGLVEHRGGTTIDFGSGPQPLFRDGDNANWDYCRTWNPEILNAEPELEPLVDGTTQCIHLDPTTEAGESAVVVAPNDGPNAARLEILYIPDDPSQADE